MRCKLSRELAGETECCMQSCEPECGDVVDTQILFTVITVRYEYELYKLLLPEALQLSI